MKQYSDDLRERLLRAIDAGLGQAEAGRLFGVGTSSIKRWRRQRAAAGAPTPNPRLGHTPRIGPAQAGAPRAPVAAAPDATLAAHPGRARERRDHVARCAGWASRSKKVLRAAERDEDRRAAWWETMELCDPALLVFVDEGGTNPAVTPRYGRAPPAASGRSGRTRATTGPTRRCSRPRAWRASRRR